MPDLCRQSLTRNNRLAEAKPPIWDVRFLLLYILYIGVYHCGLYLLHTGTGNEEIGCTPAFYTRSIRYILYYIAIYRLQVYIILMVTHRVHCLSFS